MNRDRSYPEPASRPIVVYAFDPTKGRKLNNFMTVHVPYEPLKPGPIGRKVAVIDYDASNRCHYKPVNLDDRRLLVPNGLRPTESDPRFHQQMVYAVASRTIQQFETSLGREIRWRPRRDSSRGDSLRNQLRIFPHAFQQANAFYDPELRALLFGYFPASADDPGDNLPGQPVYTCLSHDIIVHETTHAILDSIRRHFIEASGPDTPAFHEAFADIVALLQHFTMQEALIDTINRTGGLIYKSVLKADAEAGRTGGGPGDGQPAIIAELTQDNPLVELARQFGDAIGTRKALRSALGTPPDPDALRHVTEPHDRGAILVAAVFDAYFTIYVKRTRDLMRLARAGGAINPAGDLHPDLAQRLAGEAIKTARHFLNICIRALDYLPPVDVELGEFLRAVITVDSDMVPDDPYDYRAEIIKAFRLRGIVPSDVTSYSEEALRWRGARGSLPKCVGPNGQELNFKYWDPDPDPDSVEAKQQLRRKKTSDAAILYDYAKRNAPGLNLSGKRPLRVASFHPIYRTAPNGRPHVEFVVQFMQQVEVPLDPDQPDSPKFRFRGGSTVVFDHWAKVKYVIHKSVDSDIRLRRERDYRQHALTLSPYVGNAQAGQINFAAVHRGV